MNMIRMFYGVAVIGDCDKRCTARQDPIAARKALMKETAIRRRSGPQWPRANW
jgi:hypothetical protein